LKQGGHRKHLGTARQQHVATRLRGAEHNAGGQGLHRIADLADRHHRVRPTIARPQSGDV
jgi:hypothetical protein